MQDSPSSKNSGFEESKHEKDNEKDEDDHSQGKTNGNDKEEINFEENPFQIPPPSTDQ